MLVHQRHDIRLLEPHLAVRIHRQVVSKRACEQNAVYAAGRSACNRVDEDAQLQRLADRLDQFEVDFLGIRLAFIMVEI